MLFLYLFMQIIEKFQKCHTDHPIRKFFGECTDLKIKLDRCFREEVSFHHMGLHFSSCWDVFLAFLPNNIFQNLTESYEAESKL